MGEGMYRDLEKAAMAERGPSAIDHLDAELERMGNSIDMLSARLRIVSMSGLSEPSMERVAEVRPEPRSPLQQRVERLADLCSLVDRLARDLDV